MGQEFHPSYIRSSRYNYTVDYFELRAQPGRYVEGVGGDSFWDENAGSGFLFPANFGYSVIIGGNSTISNEKLRVVGPVYATEYRLGDSYIKEDNGDLIFYDDNYGQEIALSSLLSSFWTRNGANGWLFPTTSTDNLILGKNTGIPNRRIQVRTSLSNGSSYIIIGENSAGTEVFSVNDQGNVNLSGNLYFSATQYISKTASYISFNLGAQTPLKVYQDRIEGSSFILRNSNPYLTRIGYTGDGVGFPDVGVVSLYSGGQRVFDASLSLIAWPKEVWMYSGKNVLRVNNLDQIQLGSFVFDDNESRFYLSPTVYVTSDANGNMVFTDDIAGELTLLQLTSVAENYWDETAGVLSPKTTGNLLRIPALSGSGNRIVFATNNGTLTTGGISYQWTENPTYFYYTPVNRVYSVIIGKDNYTTIPDRAFEVWANNSSRAFSAGDDKITLERDTTISSGKKLNFEDTNTQVYEDVNHNLMFKDAVAGEVSLKQLNGYIHNQAIASSTWNINHGLNKQAVIVQVFDMSGNEYKAEIEHTDLNNTVVKFGYNLSGYAQCK